MEINVDYREYMDNPLIVKLLEAGGKNTVISKPLAVGDYFCPPVLVEHKTLVNYMEDVTNGHLFQQAQDMLHSKKEFPDLEPYILISGNITDIFKQFKPLKVNGVQMYENGKPKWVPIHANAKGLIAAWSSLNLQGIKTSFIGDQGFMVQAMLYSFEKYNDGKVRTYNPIRAPITSEDAVLTNYMSILGIGEENAKKLRERFPTPRKFYNAGLIEFESCIGFQHGRKLYNFINGIK